MRKLLKKVLCSVLCLAMILSCLAIGPLSASAITMADYGKNPDPDVDIAVSVPAGYPGTFEDFKKELTAALIAQGMDASSFRITDTAVKIDTTNLDGWYVYDHYYSTATYDAIVPAKITDSNGKVIDNPQRQKQPYRGADNSCMGSYGGSPKPCLIQDVFVSRKYGAPGNRLHWFNQHTYSWQTNGRANMCFAGYGTNALTDYMIYPATSDSRRTIEFDLDCAVIDTHTLLGAGFLLNAGISGGRLAGYAFYYEWTSATAANAQIRKLQNIDALNFTGSPGTSMVSKSVPLPSGTKLRIRVVLERNKVTVTQRTYTGNTMGDEVVLFDNYPIPVLPAAGNGFGPIVAYKSHGCSSMTYFQYGDLNMTYDATAFDALKEVQYVQSADQKYFVNLVVPESEDTGIPDASMDSQGYVDGITRMDQNEIFYVSNKDDGRVGTDNDGIGATNTIYTSTETDFVQELASKIANNYNDKKVYSHVNAPDRENPLSDFYIINSTKDASGVPNGSQLMTVHQRHLINTKTSVQVSLRDKSQLGNMPVSGDKLTKYEVRLTDPDGNQVELQKGLTTITLIPNAEGVVDFSTAEFTIDETTKPGRYTYSMNVTDNKGYESGWVSTYFTVFDDSKMPIATGENTTKNHATIHLTDTGQGIDEDGITFIEDNRGSGVYAYYIAENEDAANNPTLPGNEDLWVYLDEPVHEYDIDVDLEQYFGKGKKLVVYYMDECRNAGQRAIFQPVYVKVQGETPEDIIDDYYIIGETPVIVLPEDDKIPEYPDPDYEFSNWEIVPPGDNPPGGGTPITSGTQITPDPVDEPTIIIKPAYTDHKVNLTYDANASDATIPNNDQRTYTTQVVENADLAARIKAQNVIPVRKGYDFKGWYLDTACTEAGEIKAQTAATNTTVYAKWEVASYSIIFDHNGGGASGKTKIENVPYETRISRIATPNDLYEVKANEAPTKPGHIFQYWTEVKNDPNTRITTSTTTKMPDHDLTVYAYYAVDTSKYVVHFDTQGGNRIADKAYANSAAANYGTLQKPVKSGYVFEGWYVQNADGSMSDQKVELSGTNMPASVARKEHTLMAKWTPATDTPYTVSYYYNSGFKDSSGNYRYVKANNMTKTYRGTTESKVTIPEEAMLDGLEGGDFTFSRSYWRVDDAKAVYNGKNNLDWREGVVTGGEPLDLRLYYDRYFTINLQVVDGTGSGSIWYDEDKYPGGDEHTILVKEGDRPTIYWAPVDGSHTANVALDNRIRDGLLDEDHFRLEEAVHKDYYFRVRFEEGEPASSPVTKDYYTIETRIEGCFDGSCSITPTARYVAGRDSVEITWDINDELYRVDSVQIDKTIFFRTPALMEAYEAKHPDYKKDGINLHVDPSFSENEFTRFRRIAQDHKVIVNVDKVPSIGGNTTAGFYTVTVNTYNGDSNVISHVPSSQVVNSGEKYTGGLLGSLKNTVDKIDTDYNVAMILIDGKRVPLTSPAKNFDAYSFATYRVPVLDKDGNPVLDKDGKVTTTTVFDKAITSNHVIDIFFENKNIGSEDFDDESSVQEDAFNKLNTKIVGGPGVISSGGFVSNKDGENERTISWEIKDGRNAADKNSKEYSYYEVDTVQVIKNKVEDGKNVYDENGKPVVETTTYTKDKFEELKDDLDVKVDSDTQVIVNVKPAYNTVTVLKYGYGKTAETQTYFKGQSYNGVFGTPGTTSKLVKLVVDGKTVFNYFGDTDTEEKAEGTETQSLFNKVLSLFADENEAAADAFSNLDLDLDEKGYGNSATLDFKDLDQDHVVEIYFSELDPITELPKPLPKVTHTVIAKANIPGVDFSNRITLVDGTTREFPGQCIVADGENAYVSWTAPINYEVESVYLNGVKTNDVNSISIPEVTEDQEIIVNFALKADHPTNKVSVKGDPDPNKLFTVSTEIVGGKGWVTTTKSYGAGEDATVEWFADKEQVVTGSIFYQRAEDPDRDDSDVYVRYINNLGDHLEEVGGKQQLVNGELNYPIYDEHGNLKLILNWDVSGDGVPQYNIVLNGIKFNNDDARTVADYCINYNYAEIKKDKDGHPVLDENESYVPDTSMCNEDLTYEFNHENRPDYDHVGNHIVEYLDIVSSIDSEERLFVVKYVIIDDQVYIERDYENNSSFPHIGENGLAIIPGTDNGTGKGSYTFEDINRDHKVVIVVGTNPATNLPANVIIGYEKDEEGKPQPIIINVDIDGDGIPDVDIDVDGDGVPDLNLDPDNNGEPDDKIDTDKPFLDDGKTPNPGYLREDTRVRVNYLLPGHQPIFDLDDLGKSDMGDEYNTLPALLKHLGLEEKDVTLDQETVDISGDDTDDIDEFVLATKIIINDDKLNTKVEALDENGNKTTICLADYEISSDDPISGYTKSANELVTYRFVPKKTKVIVEFIKDEGVAEGENPVTTVEIPGRVFDNYTTDVSNELIAYLNSETAFGYEQVAPEPDNAEGTMTLEPITVKYHFALKSSILTVEYVDENGNLLPSIGAKVEGGDKYNQAYKVTPEKSIKGYILDETQLPDNAEGTVQEDKITVTYHYVPKDAEVTVRYVDVDGKNLVRPDIVKGKYGAEYTTTPEEIPNYKLVETVGKPTGIFGETQDNAPVVYVYAKTAQVIVKHIDSKGNEIVEPETFDYVYGDTYKVSPINSDKYTAYGSIGTTEGIVSQDTIVVIYLYNETNGSTEPNDPITPIDPVDPTPDTPDKPTEPTKPTKPTNPTKPTKPTKPADDINIDTDGDGEPDVNIDIDGDGKPDVNIDKDGDKVPDVNIDTDGDGEPDINIDKDGDGKPDINIDTDGDGKPDVNIDTDGDGEPDINIDTDGDGIADANLDTDNDGVADTNLINPIDTGSTDMYAMYAYGFVAVAALLLVVLLMRKNRREDEAEA